jgi:hypothetical protein
MSIPDVRPVSIEEYRAAITESHQSELLGLCLHIKYVDLLSFLEVSEAQRTPDEVKYTFAWRQGGPDVFRLLVENALLSAVPEFVPTVRCELPKAPERRACPGSVQHREIAVALEVANGDTGAAPQLLD